jgi:uncharacterized protein YoxC
MAANQDAINKAVSDQIKKLFEALKEVAKQLEDLQKRVEVFEKQSKANK